MMNVLNGGAHADNKVDFQEFMVMPVGASSFAEALRMGVETYHALKKTLHDRGLSTDRRRRGRLRAGPRLERGGAPGAARPASRPPATSPGSDVAIALDPAVSEIYEDGNYVLEHEGRTLTRRRAGRLLGRDGRPLPDRLASRTGWPRRTGTAGRCSTERIGDSVQLVGDDLFVTNTERLKRGIDMGVAQLDPHQGRTRSAR